MKDTIIEMTSATPCQVVACSVAGRLSAQVIQPRLAKAAPPLLVLHGISRNADTLARLFAPEADRTGRTLIVPHFPQNSWPNFQRPSKAARPDQALLALLDKVAETLPRCTGPVEIFGHSGGAQLAHRFAMLYPHRVTGLHLVAAGWYCLPNDTMPYPYGLAPGADTLSAKWARRLSDGLAGFLKLHTTVYIGTEDTSRDLALRKTAQLDALQGPNRHARAQTYVRAMNAASKQMGLSASTRLIELPGCDHDVVEAITKNGLAKKVLTAQSHTI